ncbi:MAG: drug resistance transporter, EmrB/QacA subfamily [Caulobacteraceae bacterium]|nr:drug resistance transporter, EmrB/QacA subfamily [Caulobacteraceae bacterium]
MVIALIVACAFFMENLDATIIVTALPQMAASFAITPTRMSLGVTAYVLAVAACIPASGWLADRVGARNLFCAAIGAFTVASMLCGVAPNFVAFTAARILQGAAAAMMSPVGRLVVLRNADKKDLLRALSTLVWPALFAPVLGPPLGGLITSAASWRWIFYVNLPVGLLGMALVLAFVPNSKTDERTPFDTRGFLLMAVALACLTYGLDVIGQRQGSSLPVGAGLLAAAAAVGFLAVRHVETTPQPLLRLDALRLKTFFVSSISGGTISRAAISATPFLLPLMFQVGFGLSPVQSGLLLLIYMAANLLMKTVTNHVIRIWGLRNVLVINGLIASAGIAACGLISPTGPLLLSGAILALAGASRSMQFTCLTMITFADVTPAQRAPAAVVSALTQQLGMGMGVAVGALMLNFSEVLRHAPRLEVFDFRVALVLAGGLSALAVFSYAGLDRDAGSEISGHKVKMAEGPARRTA